MSGFFLIFSQLIFGAGVYQLFSKEEKLRVEHWIFGYPLGAYLYTQIIFFEGIFGLPLTAPTYIITSVFMLIISLPFVLFIAKGNGLITTFLRFKSFPLGTLKAGFKKNLPFLLILFISILFGSVCLFHTYYAHDSLQYYFGKGAIIAADNGLILENIAGTCGLATNPLFLPLQYASFLSLGFKYSHVIFGICYLITVLTIYIAIFRVSSSNRNLFTGWIAFGCAFIFATTPAVLNHGSTALANLPYTLYFISSVALLTIGMKENKTGLIYLAFVMYTGAIWTYAFALPHYLALFIVIVAWALTKNNIKIVSIAFAITIFFSMPWPIWRILHWNQHINDAFFHGWARLFKPPLTILQKLFPYVDILWISVYAICFLLLLLSWKKIQRLYQIFAPLKSFYTTFFCLIFLVALIIFSFFFARGQIGLMGTWVSDVVRLIIWKESWGFLGMLIVIAFIFSFQRESHGIVFFGVGIIVLSVCVFYYTMMSENIGYLVPPKLTNIYMGANRYFLPFLAAMTTASGILVNDFSVKFKGMLWSRLIPILVIGGCMLVQLWNVPPIPGYGTVLNIEVAWGYAKKEGYGNHEIFIERALRQPRYKVARWMIENTDEDSELILSNRDYPTSKDCYPSLLRYRAFLGGYGEQIIHPRIIVEEDYDQVVQCLKLEHDEVPILEGSDSHPKGYRVYCDQDNVYMVGKGEIKKVRIEKHKYFMPKIDCD